MPVTVMTQVSLKHVLTIKTPAFDLFLTISDTVDVV